MPHAPIERANLSPMPSVDARTVRALRAAGFALLGTLVFVLLAWGIDSAVHADKVRRNVELVDRQIGGLSEPELRTVVGELAERYASTPVTLTSPEANIDTTAAEVGLVVDIDATVASALALDTDTALLARPGRWLGSLRTPAEARVVYRADEAITVAAVMPLIEANAVEPVEPELTVTDGVLTVVPGTDGATISPELADDLLVAAATRAQWGPIEVALDPTPLPPRFDDDDAQRLAADANAMTSEPLVVRVADGEVAVPPDTMRTWLRSQPTDTDLELVVDEQLVTDDVRAVIGDIDQPPVELAFFVDGEGRPTYREGTAGARCCAADSTGRVVEALQAGVGVVELDMEPWLPRHDAAWAESLRIVEPIGEGTTMHACCQNRVQNIHRMADLVRGAVIEPGGTFSINDHVGMRTRDKGFVEDAVIYNGRLTRDVGGGVSQFATSAFNAAFFAGLEIPEYQMHTLYISRYPYGREATLSFPAPDLKIHNNTPYGVLIWPTYTDTSITVTLYSTKSIEADQTAQRRGSAGRCTRVETDRTRTWLDDGRTEVDTFVGIYQPADGVLC